MTTSINQSFGTVEQTNINPCRVSELNVQNINIKVVTKLCVANNYGRMYGLADSPSLVIEKLRY